jgi:dihydroorotate dehydrogenase (fumarate)
VSADLSTTYLGLPLEHPVVASAGPLTSRLDSLLRLEEGGAAAVVLPSLFEEEITSSAFATHAMYQQGADVFGEALSYLPEVPVSPSVLDHYLDLVAAARSSLSIPVIASLNGMTPSGWTRYAADIVAAGANALELNVYVVAADPLDTSAAVEDRVVELVERVRSEVSVPVAVKLSPYFSALGALARRVVRAGADGLVLFNRFYQPDIDLDELTVAPTVTLSTPDELRLPLRWVGILSGAVEADLALSSGVHTPDDVVKGLLAGATVVMSTSALLQNGPAHAGHLRDGLARWLDDREYASVAELRGSMARRNVPDPDAYERANYLRVLRRATRTLLP